MGGGEREGTSNGGGGAGGYYGGGGGGAGRDEAGGGGAGSSYYAALGGGIYNGSKVESGKGEPQEVVITYTVAGATGPTASSSNHSCSNTNESGAAAPGDNIEVKVSASTGASFYDTTQWRVRFRY
jgi:hypothetical protein